MNGYATIRVQRRLLEERGRIRAYRAAIEAAVRPGDCVVDVGTGTGILAFLACRAGARRVHAIERTDTIAVAREIARANGLEDRCVFHHADLRDVTLPERADCLICDWLGPVAIDGGMVDVLVEARERFLKPGGRIVPEGATAWLCPIESAREARRVAFWDEPYEGLDISAAAEPAANATDGGRVEPGEAIARPIAIREIRSATLDGIPFAAEARFEIARRGRIDALAAFITIPAGPGRVLTGAPGVAPLPDGAVAEPFDRGARILPLRHALAVDEGDLLDVSLAVGTLGGRPLWSWSGRLRREGRAAGEFSHSTLAGFPLMRETLVALDDLPQPASSGRS